MYLLAQDYENEGNFDNAFFWYNKAAMQGLADGINNVAMYYLEGLVVTPDVDKTINLLESIADKVPVAKINLACIYRCKHSRHPQPVVICFQISIFEPLETTPSPNTRRAKTL